MKQSWKNQCAKNYLYSSETEKGNIGKMHVEGTKALCALKGIKRKGKNRQVISEHLWAVVVYNKP